MVPEASDLVDGYNFGEVWARTDLSPKERMVCVLAALMARGHWKQLRQYIGFALDMGFNQRKMEASGIAGRMDPSTAEAQFGRNVPSHAGSLSSLYSSKLK